MTGQVVVEAAPCVTQWVQQQPYNKPEARRRKPMAKSKSPPDTDADVVVVRERPLKCVRITMYVVIALLLMCLGAMFMFVLMRIWGREILSLGHFQD